MEKLKNSKNKSGTLRILEGLHLLDQKQEMQLVTFNMIKRFKELEQFLF
jgi:hypothetical protein